MKNHKKNMAELREELNDVTRKLSKMTPQEFDGMLKPELKGSGFIDGDTDFLDTNKTFKDVFPNMQKQKLYYIDNEAYYIEKIENSK